MLQLLCCLEEHLKLSWQVWKYSKCELRKLFSFSTKEKQTKKNKKNHPPPKKKKQNPTNQQLKKHKPTNQPKPTKIKQSQHS